MKKLYLSLFLILLALVVFFLVKNPLTNKTNQPANTNINSATQNLNTGQNTNMAQNLNNQNTADFQPPLTRSGERVTKKTFGQYITPQNSPIQPEKFTGYHTGADFEIWPEELNADVAVQAVCAGSLKLKQTVSGYGGVAIQNCQLNNQPITVLYGHLKLTSIAASAGDDLSVGQTIGLLGADKSTETDGERKHLHLGFHSGTAVNFKGYVNTEAELSAWIDPCLYICYN